MTQTNVYILQRDLDCDALNPCSEQGLPFMIAVRRHVPCDADILRGLSSQGTRLPAPGWVLPPQV